MAVLVGRKAPDFKAPAVLGNGEIVDNFCLSDAIKGKHAWVFFYPLDFTFVCPTELVAMHHRLSEFESRDTEIVGVSIDSHFTHHAWRETPTDKGGIGAVGYPLVADIKHQICQSYGIEHPEAGVALRASFLIDKEGTVHSQLVNNLPLGRNMDEMIRLVDALQFHEQHGEVCPAGWQKGKEGMQASTAGVADYLKGHADEL